MEQKEDTWLLVPDETFVVAEWLQIASLNSF